MWESVGVKELLQEGVIHVIICLLEVAVQLDDFVLVFLFHHVRGKILYHSLFATLRGSDATLLTFQQTPFNSPKEQFPHPLVEGDRDHLRDGWETGYRAVVRWVFPITALVYEDCPPLDEPVVFLVPPVSYLPLDHLLDQLVHRLLDRRAFLDGEGVYGIDAAGLPRGRAPEDLFKFLFRECSPAASSWDLPSDISEDFLDGIINSPPIAGILVVDAPPEHQRVFSVGSLVFASKLLGEAFVLQPEDVQSSVFPLSLLVISPRFLPVFKLLVLL